MTEASKRPTIQRRVYLHAAWLLYPKTNEATGLIEDAPVNVTDVLVEIDNLPKDLDKAVKGEHTNYLLDGPLSSFISYMSLNVDYVDEDYVMGRFGITRFYGIPQAEGGGFVSEMPLRDDQGVYDPCHFVYFLQDNRMMYEANRHGPRPVSFASYIYSRSIETEHPATTTAFKPILRGEQILYFLEGLDELSTSRVSFRA